MKWYVIREELTYCYLSESQAQGCGKSYSTENYAIEKLLALIEQKRFLLEDEINSLKLLQSQLNKRLNELEFPKTE